MKTIALFFGVLALVFSLPVGQGVFAEAGGNDIEHDRSVTIEPFEETVQNPCILDENGFPVGEEILITGFRKRQEMSLFKPSSIRGVEEISHVRLTGSGTGTGTVTGASYSVQVVEHEYEMEFAGGPKGDELEQEFFMLRVSSPTEPSFIIFEKETETPGGNEFEIEHTVCVGQGPVPVE